MDLIGLRMHTNMLPRISHCLLGLSLFCEPCCVLWAWVFASGLACVLCWAWVVSHLLLQLIWFMLVLNVKLWSAQIVHLSSTFLGDNQKREPPRDYHHCTQMCKWKCCWPSKQSCYSKESWRCWWYRNNRDSHWIENRREGSVPSYICILDHIYVEKESYEYGRETNNKEFIEEKINRRLLSYPSDIWTSWSLS